MSDRKHRRGRTVVALAALGLAALAAGGPTPGARAEVTAPPLPPARGAAVARLEHARLEQGRLQHGCGRAPPAMPPSAVAVNDDSRRLITVVPDPYDPDEPHALVIAFHGLTSSNAKVRRYYGLERHAREPTIFVYPSGRRGEDGSYSWSEPGDSAGALRDYALFDAVVALIASSYCIDPTRIFAVGHSLGAWFANSLGCARGDVLRAIGTLAGGISRSDCRGTVGAAIFHNPNDRLVDFGQGLVTRELFRAHNGVDGPGQRVTLRGFPCQRYGDATASNPVVWCPYTRNRTRSGRFYPHHWPAGAGAAMMAFFASLPEAPRASAAPIVGDAEE